MDRIGRPCCRLLFWGTSEDCTHRYSTGSMAFRVKHHLVKQESGARASDRSLCTCRDMLTWFGRRWTFPARSHAAHLQAVSTHAMSRAHSSSRRVALGTVSRYPAAATSTGECASLVASSADSNRPSRKSRAHSLFLRCRSACCLRAGHAAVAQESLHCRFFVPPYPSSVECGGGVPSRIAEPERASTAGWATHRWEQYHTLISSLCLHRKVKPEQDASCPVARRSSSSLESIRADQLDALQVLFTANDASTGLSFSG